MPGKIRKQAAVKRPIRRAAKVRKPSSAKGPSRSSKAVKANLLPIFLSGCIVFCLVIIGFLGFNSVTASTFFRVDTIDVRGTKRSSKVAIERIASSQTATAGVWNADLMEIKAKVEKMPFVRSAAISRVLPNGIRVDVFEHDPAALIRLKDEEFLVTDTGTVLAKVESDDATFPFAMVGWDESKSEKADKDNLERLKLYQAMLEEWRNYGLADQVGILDMSAVREPRVEVEESGNTVSLAVGRDNFAENLDRALRAIAGKSDAFAGVQLIGANLILEPRKEKGDASQ